MNPSNQTTQKQKENPQQRHEKKFLETERAKYNKIIDEPLKSRAWKYLTDKYGPKISCEELKSLATVCSQELNIDLAREFYRRKEMLIIWFNNNYDRVIPFIDRSVVVKDINGNPIGGYPHNAMTQF